MGLFTNKETIRKILLIIGNRPLAIAIHKSISSEIKCPFVRVNNNKTVWNVFEKSLNAAIRNIEEHPRGKLFRRLIKYGPHDPDHPESIISNNETTLSDPECALAVQFIFSHMVNRFKGELAELLAIEPCIKLCQILKEKGILPPGVKLYWGDTIEERRRVRKKDKIRIIQLGNFAKGADGVIVEHIPNSIDESQNLLRIHGIIEVKSMTLSRKIILSQIERHLSRLDGGIKLAGEEYATNFINLDLSNVIRIIVLPSDWKLSRDYKREKEKISFLLPVPSDPPNETSISELKTNIFEITLAWSKDSIEQAAYEMTFWYMSQVGKHVYTKESLPKGWESMTPEEAGYNTIKMMLYYLPLRYISKYHERLAIKLYNIYSFGYALGADSKEMLWPEDFQENK